MSDLVPLDNAGQFLLYTSKDGSIRIETRMLNETLWLSQRDMGDLFGKDKRTISEHIGNIFAEGELQKELVVRKFRTTSQNITIHLKKIYEEGELQEAATCKHYLQVQTEGERQVERNLRHYNLDRTLRRGLWRIACRVVSA
jgi:hypothetical protein